MIKGITPTFQHALIMLKPDCVARNLAVPVMTAITSRLQARGINFRIIAPQTFSMNQQTANHFYSEHVGKDWFEARVKPYIISSHPDPRIPKAPLMSFIIEAQGLEDKSLVDILRDEIIGPTNPPGKNLQKHRGKSKGKEY